VRRESLDAGRALKHLEVISRRPHAVGSAEHAAVRDHIRGELAALGLRPEVQEEVVVNALRGDNIRAAAVNNVVARLRGTGGGRALLLTAHYDERSLQHQDEYALALARRLGGADLGRVREPDSVYFDLPGTTLLRYPVSVVIPPAVLTLALFVAVVVSGLGRGRLTPKGGAEVPDGPQSLAFRRALHKLTGAMAVLRWCAAG
jgi:hypothetical protein